MKRTGNEIKNYSNTHLKKRLANMGIDPVTHNPRSGAPGTGGGGPGGGAAGAQHTNAAAAHLSHTAQRESARLEAEARALAVSAFASASVSAPPQMPGHAAVHRLDSPTSMLSYSESATHGSVLEELVAAAAAARAAMLQPMQAHEEARKDHLQQQWGDHVVDVADADIAAAHRLDWPTSMLSYSESATHGSVLEELVAAAAAARAAYAMPQPMQAHEEARKDHLQQQQWGDHVVDVANADIAAAAFAGMLLDDSLIQQQTEEEKKYWVSIMKLVNSSSASLQTSVAMPAAVEESSSSSASLQTSVAMPAPERRTRRRLRSQRQSTLPD